MRASWGWLLGLMAVLAGPVAATASAAAPDPPTPAVPSAVQQTIDQIESKPIYDHAIAGIVVADLDTGELLLSHNGAQLFDPGSILKTMSTSVAMRHLGIGYRFRTPVQRLGAVRAGTLHGSLMLVASGDFSMGLRDLPDGQLAYQSTPQIDHNYADTGLPGPALLPRSNPLAGLESLARQVRRSGIRRVTGNVVIDDRLFDSYNGWPDGLISPIWTNENVIDITAAPTRAGQPAKISYRPHTAAWQVVSRVKTGAADSDPGLQVSQDGPGRILIQGSVPAGGAPGLAIFQIPDPATFARTAFIEALRRAGVAVTARATGANPRRLLPPRRARPAGVQVALRVSPPLSEFVKVILKVSYNRGADLMLCLTAAATGSRNCLDGLDAELANNASLGVTGSETIPFDGAGSIDQDRTSPAAMVTFLRNVTTQPYGAALRDGLPIVGVDGTLATVGKGTPAAGNIFAKTGNRVVFVTSDIGIALGQSHVGYINAASGRRLVFADLLSNVPLASPEQFFQLDTDQGTIEAAIQAAY